MALRLSDFIGKVVLSFPKRRYGLSVANFLFFFPGKDIKTQ